MHKTWNHIFRVESKILEHHIVRIRKINLSNKSKLGAKIISNMCLWSQVPGSDGAMVDMEMFYSREHPNVIWTNTFRDRELENIVGRFTASYNVIIKYSVDFTVKNTFKVIDFIKNYGYRKIRLPWDCRLFQNAWLSRVDYWRPYINRGKP